MNIRVNDKIINCNQINCICINENMWFGGTLDYFLTVFTKDHDYFNYNRTYNKNTLVKQLEITHNRLLKASLNNFVFVGDFIINLNNVANFNHKSNRLGSHIVEVKFKNGSNFILYQGWDKEYANILHENYLLQKFARTLCD